MVQPDPIRVADSEPLLPTPELATSTATGFAAVEAPELATATPPAAATEKAQ